MSDFSYRYSDNTGKSFEKSRDFSTLFMEKNGVEKKNIVRFLSL